MMPQAPPPRRIHSWISVCRGESGPRLRFGVGDGRSRTTFLIACKHATQSARATNIRVLDVNCLPWRRRETRNKPPHTPAPRPEAPNRPPALSPSTVAENTAPTGLSPPPCHHGWPRRPAKPAGHLAGAERDGRRCSRLACLAWRFGVRLGKWSPSGRAGPQVGALKGTLGQAFLSPCLRRLGLVLPQCASIEFIANI